MPKPERRYPFGGDTCGAHRDLDGSDRVWRPTEGKLVHCARGSNR